MKQPDSFRHNPCYNYRVKTSHKRSFATACVSTDQKVRGSNPFARTNSSGVPSLILDPFG